MKTNTTKTLSMLMSGKKLMLATTAIAYLMICSFSAQAAGTGHLNKTVKENVQREISRSIVCPDFVTQNGEGNQVKALIRVNDKGAIEILNVETGDARLKDYVIAELKKLKLDKARATDKFMLVINFQVV